MNLYLGLADDNLKGRVDEASIGLFLCKINNKIVTEYAQRDTTKPIEIANILVNKNYQAISKENFPALKRFKNG